MANPTIGATTPRIQYTATASQTVFTVPFEFLANADLAVYVNGTLKTLTTDYTLTGANTTGGGTLTFVTGRTAGDIVTILGNLAYSRNTNKYTKFGLLPAEVLEADFDSLQVQSKQLARDGQFALRAPLTDTGSPSMTLPVVATRASKAMGFDASGNPTVSISSLADIDSTVQIIDALNALPAGASSSISYQPAGVGAVITTVQAKLREFVSVEDFGAIADWNGTTGTNNYTAFENAIAAAQTLGLPLKIAGRYYIEFGTGKDRLSVSDDLVVFGVSQELSEIKFGPNNVSKAIRGFDVTAGNFTIRDLKLTSPVLSVFPLFDNLISWNPIWFAANATTLLIERCYFGNQWHSTTASGGTGGNNSKWVFKDSYLQGYNGAVNIANNLAVDGYVIAENCTFQGHQNEGSDWAARGHCLYPHPHLSLLITGCRFIGGGRSMINHFSSGGVPYTAEPPEVISIRDCYFGAGATAAIVSAILTTNTKALTTLENCTFDANSGVAARCDTILNGCRAINGGYFGTVYKSDGVDNYMLSLQFNNCYGEATVPANVLFGGLKDTDVTSTGTRAKVVINGGYFKSNGASIIASTTPKAIEVNNATFEHVSGGFSAVSTNTGAVRLSNCVFTGAWSNAVTLVPTLTGTFEINDCIFDISTTGIVSPYSALANSISGRNNWMKGNSFFQCGNAQNLQFREGRNPNTVASAASITLSQNFNYYRVSGAATITTIRNGANNDYSKPFSSKIMLVVDTGGTWALNTGGNIIPKVTTARSANEIVSLYHDASTGLWYEI